MICGFNTACRRVGLAECTWCRNAECDAVKIELAATPVFEETFKGVIDRAERNFVPWNFCFADERCFEGFFPGIEVEVQECCPIDYGNLADVGKVDKGEHRTQLDPRARFFQGFAQCCFSAGFVVLHESGR